MKNLDPPSLLKQLLPVGCDPLPDIFTGLAFAFHSDVPLAEKKRLERLIIAYDGEVREEGSPGITHLVHKNEEFKVF